MPTLSVIICTHNPRQEYLRRTLEGVQAQTLARDQWELLLIDNASKTRLSENWDLSWHPHARHIREEELGLTPARLRGIREAQGRLLLFIDDDNVLVRDYLEQCVAIAAAHPFLPVFGAGQLIPEYEVEPAAELAPWLSMLALRRVPHVLWSNHSRDAACTPWGAGLCVTRPIADQYLVVAGKLASLQLLDRRGSSLFCGGDDLFSWASAQLGFGCGIFPQLQITHLISAGRLTQDYLVRMIHDHAYSHGILRFLLAGMTQREMSLAMRLRILLHGMKNGRFALRCKRAAVEGEAAAARLIRESGLKPLDIQFTRLLSPRPIGAGKGGQ